MSWSLPFRVPLTIAHAALLMWLVLRFANSSMIERIAAAGRAAFTNYVGASIILTTLFRSEEHTSELQSLMRISYAVFCLKKKKKQRYNKRSTIIIKVKQKQYSH